MKSSSNSTATAANTTESRNLLEVFAAHGAFKTFANAIEVAGLTETLRDPGPFTVFAPTDGAFERLPEGRLQVLLAPENKAELVALLNYHIVKGRKTAADIGKWETARTLNGQRAPIVLAGDQLKIDGAIFTDVDLASSNGMIHGIDKVNIPAPVVADGTAANKAETVAVVPTAAVAVAAPIAHAAPNTAQ